MATSCLAWAMRVTACTARSNKGLEEIRTRIIAAGLAQKCPVFGHMSLQSLPCKLLKSQLDRAFSRDHNRGTTCAWVTWKTQQGGVMATTCLTRRSALRLGAGFA